MKRKTTQNGLYDFLNGIGVLQYGTPTEIRDAKKEYWQHYKKEWNKAKRDACKRFEILLTPDEVNAVKKAAKRHHTSPTRYIKASALESRHIYDPVKVGEIRELLVMFGNSIQCHVEETSRPSAIGAQLAEKFFTIESKVLDFLSSLKQNH